jgi:hypothetical protein
LTGGGTSGKVTVGVDSTKVPFLSFPNTFTANQTVNGTLTASSLSGNGAGVTSVNAALLGGMAASSFATLGANSFVGNQIVTGNVSATSLSVASATRYLAIPCASFMPDNTSKNYARCSGQGEVYGTTAGQTAAFDAPVNLPHGAVITKVEALVKDSDASQDIAISFLKKQDPGLGFILIANFSTSGSPGVTTISSTALSHTVDNSNGAYQVRGFWTVPSTPLNLALYLVRITYTVTSPLP